MILIIKHIDIEGPGTLGDFLKAQGEHFITVELGAGEKLPYDPQGYKAVVVLGGPMNVDEEDKYPFLKPENEFIQKVLKTQVPYLGICLGSQLLAKAAGARVVKSPVKEIGWYRIQLTPEGEKDPLFKGFRIQDPIYHWHGDMFQVPAGGRLLATADGCPHQALAVGTNAYGLQFHVEVTEASIRQWSEEYCHTDLLGRRTVAKCMLEDYWKYKKAFDAQAQMLYQNFLNIANA
ncbi:MAG: type 1 glutamine amidotransferase [Candidatus Omnitrophica bacterium]|nr:type 1 glutamine amidotransferase [Candidatus Omnitrophota bacterium]MDE2010071.1 type 1 glutamine amidotransferase [Candidatus Omnitrophota bacterium]MDE2232078.1 type 1 glutamine amidotransferase [Candidatus Omnitrophota bacterium]